MELKKLPILVVAYCRAARLEQTLSSLIQEKRKIYIAIDKAPESLSNQNQSVIDCAESFRSQLDLEIHINSRQFGVMFGVPTAVDWVLKREDSCIVLEDDCTISAEALKYFDSMAEKLTGNIALISGDSPWSAGQIQTSTLSDYPLIWGWATNRFQWSRLRILIGGDIPWKIIVRQILKNPLKVLPIAYFLAAQIRVRKGIVKAWDCSVALSMLLQNLTCVIPNERLISNVGNDEFAHHTFTNAAIFRNQNVHPGSVSTLLIDSVQMKHTTNRIIIQNVYEMKMRHLLSPIKAIFS